MAINYAMKYARQVDERFKKQSLTDAWTESDYDFIGVKTVRVYNVDTVPLTDYNRTGTDRYGTPVELQDSYQEMNLSRDRAFSFTVDKGNDTDQLGVKAVARTLRRQIDERIVPELDTYRLSTWSQLAGSGAAIASEPTKSTIVGMLLTGATALDNALVPDDGRAVFLPATYFNLLRQASDFQYLDSVAGDALVKGVMGEIAGMKIVKVPDIYMPEGLYFMIMRKGSAFAPVKLQEYKTHINPPGINGALVEGRIYYDAFVFSQKSRGIYIGAASNSLCAAPEIAYTGQTTDTIAITSDTAGATIRYTVDGTEPKFSPTAAAYTAPISTAGWADGTYTVRAYASKPGMLGSVVTTEEITVTSA